MVMVAGEITTQAKLDYEKASWVGRIAISGRLTSMRLTDHFKRPTSLEGPMRFDCGDLSGSSWCGGADWFRQPFGREFGDS